VPTTSQAVAVTADEDACSFCGAPRRELDKLLAAPGHVFVCSNCVGLAAVVLEGGEATNLHAVPVEDDATCSYCGNPSSIGGVMAEADKGSPRMCRSCVSMCQRLLAPEREHKTMTRRSSKVRCSFCNVSQADTKKLVAGPGVYVCEQCILAGEDVVRTGNAAKGPRQVVLRSAITEPHDCGFCGKLPAQVKGMVKGGRGRICDECLALCRDILDEG
jgi:ATP-dependent protease Clp ATPase subunit